MLEHNGLGTAITVLTIVRAGIRDPEASFASDLTQTLAAHGRNVLLVQANLRQQAGQAAMGLAQAEGLADLLEDEAVDPVTLLVSVAQRLLVLPSGSPRSDPAALLARPRLSRSSAPSGTSGSSPSSTRRRRPSPATSSPWPARPTPPC